MTPEQDAYDAEGSRRPPPGSPPQFAAFAESPHSHGIIIGKWRGSRYVEFCRTTRDQYAEVLARLGGEAPPSDSPRPAPRG